MRVTDSAKSQLAAAYVLGTLRGPARRRLERHAVRDELLRAYIQDWQHRFASLEATQASGPLPDAIWQGIERRLDLQRQQAAPAPRDGVRGWVTPLSVALVAGFTTLLLLRR